MPANRDMPAGIPSRRETSGTAVVAARRPSGQNVARFIAREDELHAARQYTKANEATASRTQWEAKQNLRTGSGARVKHQQQLGEELDLLNKELLAVRRERIKQYYDACYAQWDEELRARGLAIVRDRD